MLVRKQAYICVVMCACVLRVGISGIKCILHIYSAAHTDPETVHMVRQTSNAQDVTTIYRHTSIDTKAKGKNECTHHFQIILHLSLFFTFCLSGGIDAFPRFPSFPLSFCRPINSTSGASRLFLFSAATSLFLYRSLLRSAPIGILHPLSSSYVVCCRNLA